MKFTYSGSGYDHALELRNSSTAQNSLEHKHTPRNGLTKDVMAPLYELQHRDVEGRPYRHK